MARDIAIRLSVEDADRVKQVLASIGASGEEAFAAFERGASRGAQSFATLERSLDPVVAGQQRFATVQAGLTRAVEQGNTTQERANALLEVARQRYLGLGDAHAVATAGASKFSSTIGQAGFQLQDFVVQVGAGQNALVALGQQGSQLLGTFGNTGAIAGAGLAIVAMAANMAVGKTAAEKLAAEMERQQAEYDAATKKAQEYQGALRAQGDQYRTAADAGERYREGLRGEGENLVQLTRYYQGLTAAKRDYEAVQAGITTRNNAQAVFRIGREIRTTLERPLTQAVPDGVLALNPEANIGGGGLVPQSQADYRQATAAMAAFRGENKVTEEAVLKLRQSLQGAVDMNGAYAASINAIIIGLDELIPQLARLDEAQRRAENRRLAIAGQASPAQLRALADQATVEVGGVYQQRQRIGALRSDLQGGLAGADAEQSAAIRSSLQSLAAQEQGLTPATQQMLRSLQDQARLASAAAGASRELLASDIALDNAARQAGLGQASLAEKLEARRLIQSRLDADAREGVRALDRQVAGAQALAAAQLQGSDAVRESEARQRAETEALKSRAAGTVEYAALVSDLTGKYRGLADAQALARSNAAERQEQQQLEYLRAEAQLLGASVTVRERELAILRERQKLEAEGVTDPAAIERRLALTSQIASETQALKRQQDALTELQNVGTQAFDRIGTAITSAFANGQLGTIRFGNIAKAVLSEVMQYALKLSIVNPVLNAVFGTNRSTLSSVGGIVGSVFGGSSAAAGGGGGVLINGITEAAYTPLAAGVQGPVLSIPENPVYSVAGGVSGLSGFGSGSVGGLAAGGGIASQLGMLSSGASILNQLSGGSLYGSIGNSLGISGPGGLYSTVAGTVGGILNTNVIGGTIAGTGGVFGGVSANATGAAVNSAGFGSMAQNSIDAAGSASEAGLQAGATLGEVAGGTLGALGGAYGIYSGIQKGGIGGAVGALGGAVTAAAGVSSLLASAGIIGASLGPIGWIAGAVLAIIGALLPGEKPSNMEGTASYDFTTGSTSVFGATGSKFSQANRDSASALIGGVVDAASRLERTLGVTFRQQIQVGVGNRDGIYYTSSDGGYGRYSRTDEGAKSLARDVLHELTINNAGQITNAAVRVPLVNGVQWDTLEGALQGIQQVLDATNRGRPSANQNIAAQNIDWRDLNNGLADLKWVKDTYDTLTQSQLPAEKFARSLQELTDKFDDAALKASQLGLSEQAVNDARARQVQGLYDQRDLAGLQKIASQQGTLTGFLDNLAYQAASPSQRLVFAQQGFGKALDAARGADVTTADLGAVTKAAQTLIEAGNAFYGTGAGGSEVQRFVRASIESLGRQLDLPAFGGSLEASLTAAVNPLKDELQLLRDQVAGLREELRTTRLLAVA